MSNFLIISDGKQLPLPFFFKIETDGVLRAFSVYAEDRYTIILKDKIETKISHMDGILFDPKFVAAGELIPRSKFTEILGDTIEEIENLTEQLLIETEGA